MPLVFDLWSTHRLGFDQMLDSLSHPWGCYVISSSPASDYPFTSPQLTSARLSTSLSTSTILIWTHGHTVEPPVTHLTSHQLTNSPTPTTSHNRAPRTRPNEQNEVSNIFIQAREQHHLLPLFFLFDRGRAEGVLFSIPIYFMF
jgi:hypothetical protein